MSQKSKKPACPFPHRAGIKGVYHYTTPVNLHNFKYNEMRDLISQLHWQNYKHYMDHSLQENDAQIMSYMDQAGWQVFLSTTDERRDRDGKGH